MLLHFFSFLSLPFPSLVSLVIFPFHLFFPVFLRFPLSFFFFFGLSPLPPSPFSSAAFQFFSVTVMSFHDQVIINLQMKIIDHIQHFSIVDWKVSSGFRILGTFLTELMCPLIYFLIHVYLLRYTLPESNHQSLHFRYESVCDITSP